MAYINSCLELLGFKDIKDVSSDSLKKAFKIAVIKAHPDKGGNADDFDNILSAYIFLLETLQRMYGGRNEFLNITTPDELKENRENQEKWIVELNEAIDEIISEFNREKFNEQFEANHKKIDNGYANWLKNSVEDTNVLSGKYGDATQKEPTFGASELNNIFIKKVKEGKPEPTSIILHPEAMAYNSCNIGTSIIEQTSGPYTSNINENPEYCDVFSAYTSDNTIYDKVTEFSEFSKTLDDIIKERQEEITPFNDDELKAIVDFEVSKKEAESQHINNIKSYFSNITSNNFIENNIIIDNKDKNKGFVINI